jgi:hypothetical protein
VVCSRGDGEVFLRSSRSQKEEEQQTTRRFPWVSLGDSLHPRLGLGSPSGLGVGRCTRFKGEIARFLERMVASRIGAW